MKRPLAVLLVEDSEDDALLLARELELGGYDIRCERVQTAAAMQEALRRGDWDLVVSDFAMPGFTGRDALAVLKESGLDLPFIMVSGTLREEDAVGALRAGAHDFVVKGRMARLVPAVERELREAERRRRHRETAASLVRAEEELRASERTYATIFSEAPFAMALSRMPERVLVGVNAAYLRLFERTREEVLGKTEAELGDFEAEQLAQADAALAAYGSVREFECVHVARSGERRLLALNLDWVTVGGERRLLTTVRDVTERKRAEEVERRYERTRALDALKSRFFAAVSHELRTPLTLILGPTQRLLDAPDIDPAARRELEVVARNARTLHRRVDELLDVAKLEAGKLRLAYAETDVARLARFVAGHFEALAREVGIAYAVAAPEGLWAEVDPDRLQRVLFNLLSNAFKFTPEGGRVRLDVRAGAADVVFEVADSGPGIPADKRAFVFERFSQLESGAARRFGGTGLGLAIARDLVDLHRGSLAVDDAPGGGARFTVTLPRAAPPGTTVRARAVAPSDTDGALARAVDEELRPRPDAPAVAPAAGDAPLVLVVEDNRDMNRFICEGLAPRFRVAAAFDGAEGLERAQALRPDLVVADIEMPVVDGEALVAGLRARPEFASVPIVVVSAKTEDELRQRLLRSGAQDYLTKPFSLEELRCRVANLLAAKFALAAEQRLREQLERVMGAITAVSRAVAALPGSDLDAVLRSIAREAQELTGARYVALGVGSDPDAPFEPWIVEGTPPETAASIGRHPRPVGMLGLVAIEGEAIRTTDIRTHPAFRGFPPAHPEMKCLLGVPIRYRGRPLGNLYLADKRGADEFSLMDQRLVELLAMRAGLAVEIARLYTDEALQRTWLETIIDQMPEGVVIVDERGKIMRQNQTAQAMSRDTGRVDPLGNPVMLDLREPSDLAPPEALPLHRALTGGERVIGAEYVMIAPSGAEMSVLVSATPVRHASHQAGAVLVFQDIQARKELERLREEWTAVVAHDLRQPLTVISLATQRLELHASRLDPRAAAAVEQLRRATTTLDRLVQDLLDATLLEAQQVDLEQEEVDLKALLATVCTELVEPSCGEHVDCHIDCPDELARVWADPGRVEQILRNLLSNAVKYRVAGTEVRVAARQLGDAVEIVVSNRGPGIPPERLPELFQRFGRFRRARTRPAGRTPSVGLGLYIARGLVEAHAGRIWAESVPGELTSFHFTLPTFESVARAAADKLGRPCRIETFRSRRNGRAARQGGFTGGQTRCPIRWAGRSSFVRGPDRTTSCELV